MLKRVLTVADEQPRWLIVVELLAFIVILILLFTGVLPSTNLIA